MLFLCSPPSIEGRRGRVEELVIVILIEEFHLEHPTYVCWICERWKGLQEENPKENLNWYLLKCADEAQGRYLQENDLIEEPFTMTVPSRNFRCGG